MSVRYLGFVLLIWFPGALHAQSGPESCVTPRLEGGFYEPKQEVYSHGTQLTYTCDDGRKPSVDGWWATSTCQNGKWFHEPQCIDQTSCIPPTIPNAKYKENPNGWYEEGSLKVTCNEGYEPRDQDTSADCINGTWTSVPICEKSTHACGEPPRIPHALIIQQGYQDVYPEDSAVQYKCEDGYTVEGADIKKLIICKRGKWTEGPTCAQSGPESCFAPRLEGGFFVPKQNTYSHGTRLTYTCNDGRKPSVDGWWATSTCQNGEWSHEPQCIDVKDCIPPEIPNAKYRESPSGWYKEQHKIRITCDQGYEPKDQHVTAKCVNGKWSSLPICERSIPTCGEPPKIPHAVILHQEYQDSFVGDSQVQYECEDGHTVEGLESNKLVFCRAGNWTQGPMCNSSTGQGGSTGGGTAGGHTTSTGSSTTSGLEERDSRPLITTVDHCGKYPVIQNGDITKKHQMFLRYQCRRLHIQVGSEVVVCYTDGTWSQIPTCQVAFCVLDPSKYVRSNINTGIEYVRNGETKYFPCIWPGYKSRVSCIDGRLTTHQCCRPDYHKYCD